MKKIIFFRDRVFKGVAHQYFVYICEVARLTTFLMRFLANLGFVMTDQMIADRESRAKLEILEEWSARRIEVINNVIRKNFITCADLKKMWIMQVCQLIQFVKFRLAKYENRIENLKNGIEVEKLERIKFITYKLFRNELSLLSALVYRNMMVQYCNFVFPLSVCCKIRFLIFPYIKNYVIRRI